MALVLLPCDLPSWPGVQRQLNQIGNVQNSVQLVEEMYRLHSMCCISLDPDESDRSDPKLFVGLQNFLDSVMSEDEKSTFFRETLPSIVTFALRLKVYKPINGLHYSLQQQADCSQLDRRFVAALVANCFFSTFPVRTNKTHPTLQDCNFACFFQHLNSPVQRRKFCNLLQYFQHLGNEEPFGNIVLARQVMSKNSLLSIDDWLECDKPLCPVIIRHDGKIEESEEESYKVCCSSSRIGGDVLNGGHKQEDMIFSAFPELFMILMSTEVLEWNEAFTAHGLQPFVNQLSNQSRDNINSEQKRIHGPSNTHICFIDAADFSSNPAEQYQPNHILRELNKSFAGFRQTQPLMRLPPIGKSCSSTPPDNQSPINESSKPPPSERSEGYYSDSTGYGTVSSSVCSHKTADQLSLGVMKSLLSQQGGLSSYVNAMVSIRKAEGLANTVQTPGSRHDLDALMAPVGCESGECVSSKETDKKYVHRLSQCSNLTDLTEGGTASEHTSTLMCDLVDLMDAEMDLQSVPSLTQDPQSKKTFVIPFYVKHDDKPTSHTGRLLLQGEDSEDSLYRDCEERVEPRCEAVGVGVSLQRPLRFNTYKPPSKQSAIKFCLTSSSSSKPLQIPHVASLRNRDLPSSPLEGASMEASFISCRTHLSSSSSKSSSSSYEQPMEEIEQGFESCMEEEEEKDDSKKPATKSTTATVPREAITHNYISSQQSSGDGRHPAQKPCHHHHPQKEENQSHSTAEGDIADRYTKEDAGDEDADEENRQPGFVLRRSASTGFILEEDDDIFVGDGLKQEHEWLTNFRHRSTNPSCSISRRNSSRYSFSSDFSSDLEDILEHFEEKMTEGPVREDPAYCNRLGHGRLLKRTLSDSLTSFSRMPLGSCPRSLSLTEKMQQERIGLEYAKRKMVKDAENPNHSSHQQPMPLTNRIPVWPNNPMEEESVDSYTVTSAARGMSVDISNLNSCLNSPQSKTKTFQLPGQLVRTMNDPDFIPLSDNEEISVTLPLPTTSRQSHSNLNPPTLPSQVSVAWWNYNSVYDFYVPLKQSKTATNMYEEENDDQNCFHDNETTDINQIVTGSVSRIPSFVFTDEKLSRATSPQDARDEIQSENVLKGNDLLSSPQISDSSQLSSPDSMESFKRIMRGYRKFNAQLDELDDPSASEKTAINAICRSKSASNVKEIAANARNEQARLAREVSGNLPGGFREYCLQNDNRVCRSVSAKNIDELVKQGIWTVMDSSSLKDAGQQTSECHGSSSLLLDSNSKLRKWQPSINLNNLECAEKIMAERNQSAILNELLNRCEEANSTGVDDGTFGGKPDGGLDKTFGRLWRSEDRTSSRRLQNLLDVNVDRRNQSRTDDRSREPSAAHNSASRFDCCNLLSTCLGSGKGRYRIDDCVDKRATEGVECSCPVIGDDASSSQVDVFSAASPCLQSLHSRPSVTSDIQQCQNKQHQHRSSDKLLELALDSEGVKPIATGSWGGGEKGGDPQLKAMIQWMAASRANAPFMMYYTGGDDRIVKLNIVCRVLLDRHWSVSHVAKAMLQHCAKKSQSEAGSEEMDFLDCLLPKETTEL